MKAKTPAEALATGMEQAEEYGDCLEWRGYFSNKGTQPSVKVRMLGKSYSDNLSVPRLIWEAEHGPIPQGKMIYRTCCNNACVCLDHLAVGTRKDMMRVRRKVGATKHSPTTLISLTLAARRRANNVNTEADARKVRELLAEGLKRSEVAQQTGVHEDMVADIANGKAWRDLSSPWAGLVTA